MEAQVPSKLLTTLSSAADCVRGHDFIQVYSHYDADGVAAAAIVAKALIRAGKEFRVMLFTTLNDYNMGVIRDTKAECIIVTDLGASYIDQFDAMDTDVVVLDHHTIISEAKRIHYANPHLYGIDGMVAGCGSTMALLFAVALDERNWDLVQVAFGGIVGDRQHIYGLSGLNVYLLEQGVKRGFIEERTGSIIPAGMLETGLYLMTDPFICGISGNKEGVAKLLESSGIGHGRTYESLSEEESRKLSSLLVLELVKQGVTQSTLEEAMCKRYHLKDFDVDATVMSAVLNACGRSGVGGIGIGAGMGDSKCFDQGMRLNEESSDVLVQNVVALVNRGLNQMKNIQWFDTADSGFTGMLCGIAMQSFADHRKPTIGFNSSNDPVNISSRGMMNQIDAGVDLAVAMREACAAAGGSGGGHRIAAGGAVPADKLQLFLDTLDRIIGEQLGTK